MFLHCDSTVSVWSSSDLFRSSPTDLVVRVSDTSLSREFDPDLRVHTSEDEMITLSVEYLIASFMYSFIQSQNWCKNIIRCIHTFLIYYFDY